MTHTALNPDTSGRTPAWLVEGVAMYVVDDDRTAEARRAPRARGRELSCARLCRPELDLPRSDGKRARRAAYAARSAAA